MSNERMKLVVSIVVLVGSLTLLGFQVRSHFGKNRAAAPAASDDTGMMMEFSARAASAAAVRWSAPTGGLEEALRANPFLGSAGAPSGASSASGVSAERVRTGLDLQGVRTGANPMAIINDRTVEIGETIAGWQVVSVDRHRVTLRKSDGTTIQLKPPRAG
jgi:hypothetical protein